MLMGLAMGCGVGFGGAFVLEQMKLAFRRPEDAELLLGIPLLAAIPHFQTAYGGTSTALPAPSNNHEADLDSPSNAGNGTGQWKKGTIMAMGRTEEWQR